MLQYQRRSERAPITRRPACGLCTIGRWPTRWFGTWSTSAASRAPSRCAADSRSRARTRAPRRTAAPSCCTRGPLSDHPRSCRRSSLPIARSTHHRSSLAATRVRHTQARASRDTHALTHTRASSARARAYTCTLTRAASDPRRGPENASPTPTGDTRPSKYYTAVNLPLCCTQSDYCSFFEGKERSRTSMTRATIIAFRFLSFSFSPDHPGSVPSLRWSSPPVA